MNSGLRYFTVNAFSTRVINGVKTKTALVMEPCRYDQWSGLGEHFGYLYNKLSFQKWLCPL